MKSQSRKKLTTIRTPLTVVEAEEPPEPDPPCYSEKISALTPANRRYLRKSFKETLAEIEEAKGLMIAYREDKETAHETLYELTFLIDDLFARCIDLIQYHPGIDDLGEGYIIRPKHTSFDQRKAYGKVLKVPA